MKTKNFFEKAGDLLICAIALPFLLAFDGVYLGCRFHEAFVTRKKENLALWKSYRKFQKKRVKWLRCIYYFTGIFLLWHFLSFVITAYTVFAVKHTLLWLKLWVERILFCVFLLFALMCQGCKYLWKIICTQARFVYEKI